MNEKRLPPRLMVLLVVLKGEKVSSLMTYNIWDMNG